MSKVQKVTQSLTVTFYYLNTIRYNGVKIESGCVVCSFRIPMS